MTGEAMLTLSRIKVSYGRLVAVDDVSMHVGRGEIVCVIGPNGAGKSTTLAAIAGGVGLMSGSIEIAGKPLAGLSPEDIARLGVSLVPEGRRIFPSLSVEENLRVGGLMRGGTAAQTRSRLDVIWAHFPRLHERRSQPGGKLSGGEQQMLAIGRALMTQPKLMLIDEPSLGLAPRIVDDVYAILRALRDDEGLTLLINEQSSERVMKLADRVYVLREHRVRLEGTCRELADGRAIRNAYFGFADERGAA